MENETPLLLPEHALAKRIYLFLKAYEDACPGEWTTGEVLLANAKKAGSSFEDYKKAIREVERIVNIAALWDSVERVMRFRFVPMHEGNKILAQLQIEWFDELPIKEPEPEVVYIKPVRTKRTYTRKKKKVSSPE